MIGDRCAKVRRYAQIVFTADLALGIAQASRLQGEVGLRHCTAAGESWRKRRCSEPTHGPYGKDGKSSDDDKGDEPPQEVRAAMIPTFVVPVHTHHVSCFDTGVTLTPSPRTTATGLGEAVKLFGAG
jgi:hypothetical protein